MASAGQRRKDENDGNCDAVIETALDIEALPNSHRDEGIADHSLPERRVRRCEDRRQQQRLGPTELRQYQLERLTDGALVARPKKRKA